MAAQSPRSRFGFVENRTRAPIDTLKSPLYCGNVKNITVSVDDETYRLARIKAAEHDTSVSALVRCFLSELASGESDVERLKREERELRARIAAFTAGDRQARDDVHGRGA
jgi:plasmid stability protein